MGGGFPAAAFGGRADVMALLAPEGPVYQAGHAVREPGRHRGRAGHPAAAATTRSTPGSSETARAIADAASAELTRAGVPHRVQWAGSMFSVFFRDGEVRNYDDARDQDTAAYAQVLPRHAEPRASTCRRAPSRRGSSAAPTTPRRSTGSLLRCPPPPPLPRRLRLRRRPPDGLIRSSPDPARTRTDASTGSFATMRAMTTPDRPAEGAPRTVVHLLRHGEVDNPERILYGRLPHYRLSELGRRMATMAADHLADHDITLVVASPLQRAQETAAPVARPARSADRDRRAGSSRRGASSRAWPSPAARACSATHGCTRRCVNPAQALVGRALHAEMAARDGRRRRRRPAAGPRATRRSSSPTRRRSGSTGSSSRGGASSTTRARRQCALASLTSLTYLGEDLLSISYSEPAAPLVALAQPGAGA